MADPGQRLGLPGETLGEGGAPGRLGGEDLESHQAVQLRLPGLVDGSHPAMADELQDLVHAEEIVHVLTATAQMAHVHELDEANLDPAALAPGEEVEQL